MARVNGITQFLPASHTTILTLLRKHSPDGATRTRQYTSDIAYYSIYRPRKDERLSWPSWLTYSGRFTHISGHPSAAGRAWDRETSPVKDQCSNQCATQPNSHAVCRPVNLCLTTVIAISSGEVCEYRAVLPLFLLLSTYWTLADQTFINSAPVWCECGLLNVNSRGDGITGSTSGRAHVHTYSILPTYTKHAAIDQTVVMLCRWWRNSTSYSIARLITLSTSQLKIRFLSVFRFLHHHSHFVLHTKLGT